MAVLKQAECHVTLANEGAFSFLFFPPSPSSPSLALRAHECYVGTTSAHGASYSWPTCQFSCLLQRDLLAVGVFLKRSVGHNNSHTKRLVCVYGGLNARIMQLQTFENSEKVVSCRLCLVPLYGIYILWNS